MYPAPGITERIGRDWDWIWIDAQHGDLDYRDVSDHVRASQLIQRPCAVRVPAQDPGWISKVLDLGASAVIVPLVESIAEARAMVSAAKFPPLGNRSYGGRRIIDLEGRNYYKTANTQRLLILQVESNVAADLADEIAAIEGVDGLFLGPDDLLIRDGQDVGTPKNRQSIGRQSQLVAQACLRHEKLSVCVSVTPEAQQMALELGYQLVVGGGDVGFLAEGSARASAAIRKAFAEPSCAGTSSAGLY